MLTRIPVLLLVATAACGGVPGPTLADYPDTLDAVEAAMAELGLPTFPLLADVPVVEADQARLQALCGGTSQWACTRYEGGDAVTIVVERTMRSGLAAQLLCHEAVHAALWPTNTAAHRALFDSVYDLACPGFKP